MTDVPVTAAPQPEQILVAVAWPYASGPAPPGSCCRRLCAAGHLCPLPPHGREQRADGLWFAHGTPITVAADKLGVIMRELVEQNCTPGSPRALSASA